MERDTIIPVWLTEKYRVDRSFDPVNGTIEILPVQVHVQLHVIVGEADDVSLLDFLVEAVLCVAVDLDGVVVSEGPGVGIIAQIMI